MKIENYDFGKYIYYRVGEYDTKDSLSALFNIGYDKIALYNKSTDFYEGEYFVIPDKLNIHYVKPLETLNSIAYIYKLSPNELSQKNGGIKEVYIGQPLFI